jgi:DNA-binding transcriptional regulator YiaG
MYANRAHGRQETYNRGCRCDLCREVEAARHQRKRARKKYGLEAAPRVYPTVPLEPLLERVAIHFGRPADQISQYDFARAVGVHQRTICRWIKNGRVPENQLDRVAINLGWHPAAIWGVDWYIETYDTGVNA